MKTTQGYPFNPAAVASFVRYVTLQLSVGVVLYEISKIAHQVAVLLLHSSRANPPPQMTQQFRKP